MPDTTSGPPARFPLGIVPAFLRDPLGSVTQWSCDYGPVVALPVVPGYHLFMVNHPDTVRELLVDQTASYEKPPQFKKVFHAAFGEGLFFSEGAFWKRQRKLMQPAFHHKQILSYGDIMTRHTSDMLAGWKDGDVRHMGEEMHALTMRIVLKAIFDADAGERADRFRKALTELGTVLARQTFSVENALPEWFPSPLLRRKRRLSREIDAIVYDFIAERRAARSDSDLMSVLMNVVDEETGERMDDRQLHDEVLTLFIAGHDTTANLMTWVWAMLAQHPQVESALHIELEGVLKGRLPTAEDLSRLPLTEQIIRETLRLYPVAWINFRVAMQDTTLGGVRIPRGSQIWFVPYAMHHNAAYFDRPDSFHPARFAEDWEDRIGKYAYFPFGGGPRVCIGNGFAMLEARLILATVAQKFRLSLESNAPVEVQVGPVLSVKGGLPMRLTAR